MRHEETLEVCRLFEDAGSSRSSQDCECFSFRRRLPTSGGGREGYVLTVEVSQCKMTAEVVDS